jgi:hypothetical protein
VGQVAVQPALGSAGLGDVKEISTSEIWAVGAQAVPSPTPVIELSQGQGFTLQSVPSFGSSAFLTGVDGLGPNDVWAVGSYFDSSNVGHTLVLHWDGTAWSQVASSTPAGTSGGLRDVTEVASNDVWAVGFTVNNTDGTYGTLAEHWDGSTWSVVPTPSPVGRDQLSGVDAVSSARIYAAGVTDDINHPHPLMERWTGTSWKLVGLPTFSNPTRLFDVAATGSGNVWAVGSTNLSAPKTVILQKC